MPRTAVKATWEVQTGIIPGTPQTIEQFHYTSDEYEADRTVPLPTMPTLTGTVPADGDAVLSVA